MTPLCISQTFHFCIPMKNFSVNSTPKTQLLTFPYDWLPCGTVDANAGRKIRNSAIFCFAGENQHQKFMLAIRCGWETQWFYQVKLTQLMSNINLPEHVGNGASHFPLSKHVSSFFPSNTKSLVHSNCSLCPIFIFLFPCGSLATRR